MRVRSQGTLRTSKSAVLSMQGFTAAQLIITYAVQFDDVSTGATVLERQDVILTSTYTLELGQVFRSLTSPTRRWSVKESTLCQTTTFRKKKKFKQMLWSAIVELNTWTEHARKLQEGVLVCAHHASIFCLSSRDHMLYLRFCHEHNLRIPMPHAPHRTGNVRTALSALVAMDANTPSADPGCCVQGLEFWVFCVAQMCFLMSTSWHLWITEHEMKEFDGHHMNRRFDLTESKLFAFMIQWLTRYRNVAVSLIALVWALTYPGLLTVPMLVVGMLSITVRTKSHSPQVSATYMLRTEVALMGWHEDVTRQIIIWSYIDAAFVDT